MPNWIVNRISMSGPKEEIAKLVERYSTSYPREERKAVDDRLIYENKTTGKFGWYNRETNEFEENGKGIIIGVPEGFEQEYDEAWTRFPDFDKIVPMPEGMNINADAWLMPLDNQFSREDFKTHLDKLREQYLKDPEKRQDDVENFIKGIRNYIKYGSASWYDWSIKNWGTKWNCAECQKVSDSTYEFHTPWSGVFNLIDLISKEFPKVHIVYEWSDEDIGSNCGSGEYQDGEIYIYNCPNSSKEAYELAFKLHPGYESDYEFKDGEWKYKEEEE